MVAVSAFLTRVSSAREHGRILRKSAAKKMEAVQLTSFEGISSLSLMDIVKPSPGAGEGLIQVKVEGINDAKAEQISGKDPTFGKELPFTGLEVAAPSACALLAYFKEMRDAGLALSHRPATQPLELQ